jgi:dipicolinate synthase subunit A
MKYSILGGDYRYKILVSLLRDTGYAVNCYANAYAGDTVTCIDELLVGADMLIAPIPLSKDGETVYLAGNIRLGVGELFSAMDKQGCRLLAGGVINDKLRESSAVYGIKLYDFFDMEEVAVLNAIPTAEGAVQTAMEESDKTIFGSRVLVLGYGRCGKMLANCLKGIGASVTVSYRRETDRAYISSFGYRPIAIGEIISYADEFDFIFNTVPALVLDRKILKKLKRGSVIIDIAQSPGGTDFDCARDLNIKALYCPGLPGRVAPYTAAEILKDAVINISLSNQGQG